jgi:hypothetical protein
VRLAGGCHISSVARFFRQRFTQYKETYEMNPLAPVLATFLPAAVIAAEHYAPWQQWLGRKLPRLAAYTLGTLAILVPGTLAAQPRKHRQVVAMFWTAAAAAGATTLAVWGIDWLNERAARAGDERDRLLHGR